MSDALFQGKNNKVIKLSDKDFKIYHDPAGNTHVKLINPKFHGKDGYVMIFASWCPHCRAKEDFWSYLAQQFNANTEFARENFRIGIIDAENPDAQDVIQALGVGPIPNFQHVVADPRNPKEADLVEYVGLLSIEGFLGEACKASNTDNLCQIDRRRLNAPPIGL